MTRRHFQLLWGLFWLALITVIATGCGGTRPALAQLQSEFALAPESDLPDFVQTAAPKVKEAYQFAIANPEVLQKIPCYCGCSTMGHQHNLHCYLKEVKPNGSIAFDNHAVGCSICVDTTQDVMQLMHQGQNLKDIRAYIDQKYSQYGPPTNTPPAE